MYHAGTILCAVLLDFLVGDPQAWFHPVRLMGRFMAVCERFFKRRINNEYIGGGITWLTVLAVCAGTSLALTTAFDAVAPVAGFIARTVQIYVCIAARDLGKHALKVYRPMKAGNTEAAREQVAMIVSRDAALLDETGIIRSAVESVAENTNDSVVAPLLFAAFGGPVACVAYRAINTMDAMFGYKNERYLKFGRVAARADDAVNYIPARLSAAVISCAALLAGMRADIAVRTALRDAKKHPSPNAGFSEAAFAGAMGISLGGPTPYFGRMVSKPWIGTRGREITCADIRRSVALLYVTAVVSACACAGLSLLIY